MITTTHLVINALTARSKKFTAAKLPKAWFIFGGLAPDLFLYAASLFAFGYYRIIGELSGRELFDFIYDDLFFNNPLWIVGQNLLHAPMVLLVLYLLGTKLQKVWLRSLSAGCGLHTVIDILTHNDDGPLVFFPFNWQYRFSSPISYWDPEHYGNIVGPIDLSITVIGACTLVFIYRKKLRTLVRSFLLRWRSS